MAEIRPLHAVRYDPDSVGSLDAVVAPPYDVIDEEMRAALCARSPFSVVEIDLPRADGGDDPYLHAQTTYEHWLQQGILVREREPSVWALTQDYAAPTAAPGRAAASSRACAWRTTAPAASARTSAPIRARRRTGSS